MANKKTAKKRARRDAELLAQHRGVEVFLRAPKAVRLESALIVKEVLEKINAKG